MPTRILDDFMKEMSFKYRRFGGVDEVNALSNIGELSNRYESFIQNILNANSALKSENDALRSQIYKEQQESEVLKGEIDALKQTLTKLSRQSRDCIATEKTLREILQECRAMNTYR